MSDDQLQTGFGFGQGNENRRTVLEALAAGGLAGVGFTGVATANHGATGGTLLTVNTEFGTGEPQIGALFFISDDFAEDFKFPASCHVTESQLKSYKTSIVLFYRA